MFRKAGEPSKAPSDNAPGMDAIDQWLARFRAERAKGLRPNIEECLRQLPPELRSHGRDRLVEELAMQKGTLQISLGNSSSVQPGPEIEPDDPVDSHRSSRSMHDPASVDPIERRLATVRNSIVPSDEPEVAVQLSGFQVIDELGRGAYGVVYRARDELLDRQVAIKVPLLKDPKWRQQYIDEARKAVRLEFPGIVPIYHIGISNDGQPFVVQKLIEGPTLRGLLNSSGGALPILQAIRLILDVCRAVASAHASGVVHRDLKPENLLIDNTGLPWVADFGLAVREEDQGTRRGEVAGTPLYMSPEQFKGRADWLDGRSDIWSIGIMLYEMLVGKVPFDGSSVEDLKEQILHKEPRPLQQRSPLITRELDDIFYKCCSKDVTQRYATATELASDLESFLETTNLTETDCAVVGVNVSSLAQRALSTRIKTANKQTRRSSTRDALLSGSGQSSLPFWTTISMIAALFLCATAIGLVVLMILNPGKQPNVGPVVSNANGNGKTLDVPPKEEITDPKTEPKPPLPPKRKSPFTVDLSGKAQDSFISLAEAISECNEGDTVYLQDGIYRESLELRKGISLIGKSSQGKVIINVSDAPCLRIDCESTVTIQNIQLDSQGNKESNTIDLVHGSLKLNNCQIFAQNWDCVKVRPGTSFDADTCVFTTSEHPAVQVEQAQKLSIRNSYFRFQRGGIGDSKKIGIQVEKCGGTLVDCTFEAGGVAGIDWRTAGTSNVQIQDCTLRAGTYGIVIRDCQNVTISSSNAKTTKIENCVFGILVTQNSKATVNDTSISSEELASSGIGMQVKENSEVICRDVSIDTYNVGVDIQNAIATIADSRIRSVGEIGVIAHHSKLKLDKLSITNSEYFGIVSTDDTGELDAKRVDVSKAQIGLWVHSGNASLKNHKFDNCGLAVQIGPLPDGSLPRTAKLPKPEKPIRFYADQMTITSGEIGIHYSAPSTTTILNESLELDDQKKLVIDPPLRRIDQSMTEFEIVSPK